MLVQTSPYKMLFWRRKNLEMKLVFEFFRIIDENSIILSWNLKIRLVEII